MSQTKLEKILTPKKVDGKLVTMFRFRLIQDQVDKSKFADDDKLRRELIFAGALRFENIKAKKIDRERWGLAVENLSTLEIDDKKSIKNILDNMNKNKELMPKYLAQLLLNHPEHKQRKFSTIHKKLMGFEEDEIRKILVFAGAIQFWGRGKEFWGLATRNLEKLGFSEKDVPKKLIKNMENEPQRMPYHLAELLLENPLFYRRTFLAIQKKLGGFSDKEIRSILVNIDALRFEDKKGIEYWGLKRRNKELLKEIRIKG